MSSSRVQPSPSFTSELRSWLLFYSLPLLKCYLPPLHYHHYALLVCAIHILLKESIATSELLAAETMITDFLALLPDLYGENSCTANSHALSHIPMFVQLWGPLWTHSVFSFESKNGHLKKLIHSKTNVLEQLIFSVDVQQTMDLVQEDLDQSESEQTLAFLAESRGQVPRSSMTMLNASMYCVGKQDRSKVTTDEASSLSITHTHITTFSRAYIHGVLYHSVLHDKKKGKRNSRICMLKDSHGVVSFGEIQRFMIVREPCVQLKFFSHASKTLLKISGNALSDTLQVYKEIDLLSKHIHLMKKQPEQKKIVPMFHIAGKVVLIEPIQSDYRYIISQPNILETHTNFCILSHL